VCDRAAEGAVGCGLGIDVDPLPVAGRLREEVHLLLVDSVPRAHPEIAPRGLIELGDRQRGRHDFGA